MEPVRRSFGMKAGIISCLEWNSGTAAETLLFAHANGFNAQTYRALLAPLSAEFRIIACDLRGHGFTTLPARPGLVKGWSIFRDDLLGLADEISENPVILAGHSLGAIASLMAAAGSSTHVRSLVLVEPVMLSPPLNDKRGGSNSLAEMAAQRRSVFPSVQVALDYYRNRGIFARWPETARADYLAGGLIDNGDGMLRLACVPKWEAEIFRETPFGIAAIAAQVKCPITVLRGTVASTVPDDQVAVLLRLRPDARVVTIEGASHFLPMEERERTCEEMLRAARF
jgi:pimeloyl-ACP methyl ester carboxylesterase